MKKIIFKADRSTVKSAAFIIKSCLFWPWLDWIPEVDPPYLSMSESLMLVAMVLGWASLSLKMLSMTESSVLVVSSPQKAHQSLTTIPAAITSLPRFTVPACQDTSREQGLPHSSHSPATAPHMAPHTAPHTALSRSSHSPDTALHTALPQPLIQTLT